MAGKISPDSHATKQGTWTGRRWRKYEIPLISKKKQEGAILVKWIRYTKKAQKEMCVPIHIYFIWYLVVVAMASYGPLWLSSRLQCVSKGVAACNNNNNIESVRNDRLPGRPILSLSNGPTFWLMTHKGGREEEEEMEGDRTSRKQQQQLQGEKKWQHKVVIKAGWEASAHAQLTFQRRSVHLVAPSVENNNCFCPMGSIDKRQTKEDRLARAWPKTRFFTLHRTCWSARNYWIALAIEPTRRTRIGVLKEKCFGIGFWRNVENLFELVKPIGVVEIGRRCQPGPMVF